MVHRLEKYLLFNLCDLAAGLCPLSTITAKESLSKITCIAENVRAISQHGMFDPWLVPRGLLLRRELLF